MVIKTQNLLEDILFSNQKFDVYGEFHFCFFVFFFSKVVAVTEVS